MKFVLFLWIVFHGDFILRGREFGRGFEMSSKFDLEDFAIRPSAQQLEKCRKDDLFAVADLYQIRVPRSAVKREVKEVLLKYMVENGILPEEGELEGVADSISSSGGEGAEQTKPQELISIDPAALPSTQDPLLNIKLKELELELSRQQYQSQLLQVKTVELETRRAIRLKELELEIKTKVPNKLPSSGPHGASTPMSPPPINTSTPCLASDPVPQRGFQVSQSFDISRQIVLVPLFRESEVDTYFTVFERIATTLQWPRNVWPLLLQCKLVGNAQEVCSALTLEQSLDYDAMENAVLRAYELVPEAYRQKFRNYVKSPGQTFVEFARDKSNLFEKWCTANKVTTLEQLRELILLEDFKNSLPEKIVIYLNEQKVSTLTGAAVFSDEFVLTHRVVFSSPTKRNSTVRTRNSKDGVTVVKDNSGSDSIESRECFYCHEAGHLIAACPLLKRKTNRRVNISKSVALVDSRVPELSSTVGSAFEPFTSDGMVSFDEAMSEAKPVCILRDTGSAQSFILESILPFSTRSSCGADVLVKGIDLTVIKVPLHNVFLQSSICSGFVKLAVCAELPVEGVSLILGNDLAGKRVFCLPEVTDDPVDVYKGHDVLHETFPDVFSACAVTRAQSRKFEETVDLSDSFLATEVPDQFVKDNVNELNVCVVPNSNLPLGKLELIKAQHADPTLTPCFATAVKQSVLSKHSVAYYCEEEVLMRKWSPPKAEEDWNTVYQVVVPEPYRLQVLSVAHEHELSGHVGIRKTYDRLLKHFFWPSMKSDVVKFCKSCHPCQLAGKPNQVIPPAPLKPIPVLGEPFERI